MTDNVLEQNPKDLLVTHLLSSKKAVRPDDVTSFYSDKGVAVNVRILDEPDDGEEAAPLVLLEGDKTSLLFLADLLLAQASDPLDCGFQLTIPSKRFFADHSEYGLYIHRLPCAAEPDRA